jgi:DNA-binding transcriptional regulator YiaG
MPNVNAVLNQQITRLSKRVVNATTGVTRKLVAQHRRELAALKRQIAALTKRLGMVERKQPKEIVAPPELVENARFRADGLKSHRAKLGISAADYGKLVGVSALTIYHWESGKSRPRRAQLPKIVAVRGLGKREAMARLGLTETGAAAGPKAGGAPAGRRKRGTFAQTAEEMILGLLSGRKALTTTQLAAAWKNAGRGGAVDNTLSRMVKARKLKRTSLGGKKGSEYRAA